MIDEGYIKFNYEWKQTPPLPVSELTGIMLFRQKCFQAGFIGVYKDSGIGFGNISMRYRTGNQFIISGTQTGHLSEISAEHFTLVTSVDFEKNMVRCAGPVKASAESLTHAIFYELDEKIKRVLHIHHRKMWESLKFKVPTTNENIPYGTLEMVNEVRRLYRTGSLPKEKILVMAGHEEGIVSFGKSFKEAYGILISGAAKMQHRGSGSGLL